MAFEDPASEVTWCHILLITSEGLACLGSVGGELSLTFPWGHSKVLLIARACGVGDGGASLEHRVCCTCTHPIHLLAPRPGRG